MQRYGSRNDLVAENRVNVNVNYEIRLIIRLKILTEENIKN